MTELQQQSGGSVADFSAGYVPLVREMEAMLTHNSIPFSQMPPGAQQLPEMAGFDPASYMSPMDLYDSIFWGEQASDFSWGHS